MSIGKVSAAVKYLSADTINDDFSLESQISCGLDKAGCPVSQSVKDNLVDNCKGRSS